MSEKHGVMAADHWLNYVHPDKLAQDEYKEHFEKYISRPNQKTIEMYIKL